MNSKNRKSPSKSLKSGYATKSRTPSKQTKRQIPSSIPLNTSFSSYTNSSIRDQSSEPVRMAIKLEDILKPTAQAKKSANFKPELIEPEIESSIPCFEYAPKSAQHNSNPVKNDKFTDKLQISEGKPGTPAFNDFSLDKMNDDCKNFEKNLLSGAQCIEEIQQFFEEKFNCRVKLKPENKSQAIPSVVLVKTGNTFEVFNLDFGTMPLNLESFYRITSRYKLTQHK